MDPARFDQSVAFDPPSEVDDGYGGVTPGWGTAYACPARFKVLRYGESVMQRRLAGRRSMIVTIRANSTSRTIDESWRMRDLRTGRFYNVRGAEILENRHHIELLVEGGDA